MLLKNLFKNFFNGIFIRVNHENFKISYIKNQEVQMNNQETTTKELIRDTAIELFKKYGYEKVTIQQICKACQITKRTFYYHFSSKGALLTGLNDYLGMHAENLLSTVVTQNNNIETLWTLMRVYCENSQSYGFHLIKQLYIQSLEDSSTHFPNDMYLYPIAVQLIKNAQSQKEIQNTSKPEDIAFSLYHGLRSVSITWAFENGSYDLVSEFKRVFITTLNYQHSL